MNIKDIREIFEEKADQAYIDREGQIPNVGQYIGSIVDIIITMKSGCKITIFCGADAIIDCTNSHPNSYIGIDDTLIEPMKDIVDIQVQWRK